MDGLPTGLILDIKHFDLKRRGEILRVSGIFRKLEIVQSFEKGSGDPLSIPTSHEHTTALLKYRTL